MSGREWKSRRAEPQLQSLGEATQTFHWNINKTHPWSNTGYERRRTDWRIKDGGIKWDGCDDRWRIGGGACSLMWLSLGETVLRCSGVRSWVERQIFATHTAQSTPGVLVGEGGSYTDIRVQILTCEVSLSGGCLSISGSYVSLQPSP